MIKPRKRTAHGGLRAGAGRPPGARNKATLAREAAANKALDEAIAKLDLNDTSRFSPLETLLLVMHVHLRAGNLTGAAAAARDAAPFVHAKVAVTTPTPQFPAELTPDPPPQPDEPGPENPIL